MRRKGKKRRNANYSYILSTCLDAENREILGKQTNGND